MSRSRVRIIRVGEQGPVGPQGETGPAGPSVWGGITGTLSTQTDLQTALNGKEPANLGSYAFAALPSMGVSSGDRAWCIDGLGFWVRYNGLRWVQESTHIMWTPLQAEVTTDTTGNEQIAFQVLLPAGMLDAGYVLDFEQIYAKSGSTDSGLVRIRIGTSGTIADTQVLSMSYSASTRQVRIAPKIRIVSATSVMTSTNLVTQTTSTSALPADVTISNVSNPLYISTTFDLNGTTNSFTLKSSEMYIARSA